MYKIKQYSKDKAKQLGVQIKPSTNSKKKLDVFKEGIKVASIGDVKYKDYPTYLQENKQLAEERRRLYKIRHKNDLNKINSNGYYANLLLW
jgi:hypothetical protein